MREGESVFWMWFHQQSHSVFRILYESVTLWTSKWIVDSIGLNFNSISFRACYLQSIENYSQIHGGIEKHSNSINLSDVTLVHASVKCFKSKIFKLLHIFIDTFQKPIRIYCLLNVLFGFIKKINTKVVEPLKYRTYVKMRKQQPIFLNLILVLIERCLYDK